MTTEGTDLMLTLRIHRYGGREIGPHPSLEAGRILRGQDRLRDRQERVSDGKDELPK